MPTPRRRSKRPPKPAVSGRPETARRRALELLAASPDGCSEAMMIAHGISIEMMVEMINAGLATATAERVVAGSRKIEVATVKITDAGRRALNGNIRKPVR
jgi:hypothetical protein